MHQKGLFFLIIFQTFLATNQGANKFSVKWISCCQDWLEEDRGDMMRDLKSNTSDSPILGLQSNSSFAKNTKKMAF